MFLYYITWNILNTKQETYESDSIRHFSSQVILQNKNIQQPIVQQ
jgi:hypothetical protein